MSDSCRWRHELLLVCHVTGNSRRPTRTKWCTNVRFLLIVVCMFVRRFLPLQTAAATDQPARSISTTRLRRVCVIYFPAHCVGVNEMSPVIIYPPLWKKIYMRSSSASQRHSHPTCNNNNNNNQSINQSVNRLINQSNGLWLLVETRNRHYGRVHFQSQSYCYTRRQHQQIVLSIWHTIQKQCCKTVAGFSSHFTQRCPHAGLFHWYRRPLKHAPGTENLVRRQISVSIFISCVNGFIAKRNWLLLISPTPWRQRYKAWSQRLMMIECAPFIKTSLTGARNYRWKLEWIIFNT